MSNNMELRETLSKCTCVEHDPYCCQIHGNCPVCVKPEEPEDVVLGYKTSLVAQTMDSMTNNKQQTSVDTIIKFMEDNQYFIGNDLYEFLKQAKEMEKEKMIEFAVEFFYGTKRVGESLKKDFIELYNKTYGDNNE